jgi:hypothetical protein
VKTGLPIILALLAVAGLTPIVTHAQDDSDYKVWMKQVDKVNGSLRKELKAKMGDAAAADANTMADVFAKIGQFWQQRGTGDAAQLSSDSVTSFKQVAALASAGKFDEASTALKSGDADCSACHKLHRAITIHGSEIK